MQEASEFSYDHRAFIFEFKVQTSCILSQFQELGTRWLVRASASSILREGDWSHVGDLIGLMCRFVSLRHFQRKQHGRTKMESQRNWVYSRNKDVWVNLNYSGFNKYNISPQHNIEKNLIIFHEVHCYRLGFWNLPYEFVWSPVYKTCHDIV